MATLADYARFYVRLLDGSHGYDDQLRWAISSFEHWAGRTIQIHELTEELLNDYLASTKDKHAPNTRRSRRNALLRLWRHAATNVALDPRPLLPNRDLIGRVKKRQVAPTAWSKDDVRKLLDTAENLRGKYAGKISKRLYWRAYLLAAWSTGMRRCDLVCLNVSDIPASGRLLIVQVKTGRHVVGQLSHEAMTAINALVLHHGQDRVFPQWCRVQTWRKIARRLVKKSGLRMSIGKMRASAGTEVENKHPGKGPQFLGNSPQVFYSSYYDRRLADDLPQPDSLTE